MSEHFFLKIANHHARQSHEPTVVDSETANLYIGYFENSYGEQWVYTLDRDTGRAILRGGDVGWNNAFDVTDGPAAELMLGKEELLWLQACLHASWPQRTSTD